MMTDCTNSPVKCRKGGRRTKAIYLDADTERLLREIVDSPIWSGWQTRRAEVILEIAKGARVTDLIDRLGVSRSSVQRTCRTFEKEGVAGLITRQSKKGRPRMMLAEKAG